MTSAARFSMRSLLALVRTTARAIARCAGALGGHLVLGGCFDVAFTVTTPSRSSALRLTIGTL